MRTDVSAASTQAKHWLGEGKASSAFILIDCTKCRHSFGEMLAVVEIFDRAFTSGRTLGGRKETYRIVLESTVVLLAPDTPHDDPVSIRMT
jgi:hypothetical protein